MKLCMLVALVGVWSTAQGAPTTADPGCGTNPADIEFLLDSSGSVQAANFRKQLDFVKKFANSFNIGPNAVRIGAATFSTTPHNEFWMNQHMNKGDLVKAIDQIKYPGGNTHTELGLKFIRNNAFTQAHGDRDRVANILIVVTDGQSTEPAKTRQEVAEIHKANINIFAIGVGNGVDRSELELIASDPKNVFTVSDFSALNNIQATLKKTACEVNGNWSPWGFYSPCTKTCGGGTQYRERTCTDPAPAHGGKACVGNAKQTRQCSKDPCTTLPPPTTKPTIKPQLQTTPAAGCGVQPADILFIVDASGSVTAPNFQKTLTFVENMVNGFVVSPNDTQVGMITFDTKPYLQFHFNKFNNKQSVVNKVKSTSYTKGGTNTHLALQYAKDNSFKAVNGMRPGAAQIAIVITDGQSANAGATAAQAKALRDKGVTVFSIGVGSGAKQSELKAIATDPDNQHVFVVTNFDSLKQIKGTLQQQACNVKPTVLVASPTPKTCGGQADIVFLLDKSGSVGQSNFNKMLDFVKNIADDFTIGPNDVQVSVDTFSTAFNSEFKLNQHNTKQSLKNAVGQISYTGGGTNTGDAIRHMRQESFNANAGHRANVPKIAIIVTDGQSNNKQSTISEAQKARANGITMLAIGIGSGVDDSELNAIATDPDSQNVYKASTFDALKSLRGFIAAKACDEAKPQPSQVPVPNQAKCGAQADIVFMLDSSGSVGSNNFKLLLGFVNAIVKDLEIGQSKIRVGVEKFSSRPYNEFNLNKYNDKTSLMNAVSNIKFQRGGTNTADAIKYMDNNMFQQRNGDRPGVPNIGIIITDGKSNNAGKTKAAAKAARDHGINIFSVGVGKGISKPELNEMATDPDNTHVLTVDDFSKLSAIKGLFKQQACQAIPPTLPPYTPTKAPNPTPAPDPCKDAIPNCDKYGKDVCTAYKDWAQNNCQLHCGFCTTSVPTIPPPCVDKLPDCPNYDVTSCTGSYKPWAMENCRKYCGYCADSTLTGGYFDKCFYKGKQYNQGDKWQDGCAYECECTDASKGNYQCFNKCPTYYNLPPKCTLVQKQGKCCLEPVCNFDATYTTKTGQNVSELNGNKVCVYNGRKYYQSQVWTVGCEFECICDDAGVGLYSCQSRCPHYGNLPSNCKLAKPPGECCEKPDCEFQTQVGTFTGKGTSSGPGVNGMMTTPPPCVDKKSDCNTYQSALCTDQNYRPFALDNCRKFCGLCNTTGTPSPSDRCVYKGKAYKQGEAWYDGCDKICVCDNAAFGYYRCDDRCPDYLNIPTGCALLNVANQCCKALRCNSPGTFTGSQTVPNTLGAVPQPYPVPNPNPNPNGYPTLAPGQTYAPGQNPYPTLAPGQTYAPGQNPYPTLAPGQTYAPGQNPFPTLAPGQTYAPGQNPFPTLAPGQTYAPGQNPFPTLAPGQTYAPGQNPFPTLAPGQTYAPGQNPYPFPTLAPGQTYAPGQNPFPFPTLAPGQTYAPGQNPYPTLAPGQTYAPGQNPYPTLAPGQTYAPGQNPYPTLAPGQTYAPGQNPYPTLAPGQTYAPGQNPYPTLAPGQTYAPGQNPYPTLAPGQSPNPNGGQIVVPPKLNGCVYKGVLYQQGQRWSDGCTSTCVCENGNTGKYRCSPRCPNFNNLDPRCTLKEDPNDACCKFPDCPKLPNGQVINVVPTYGQGTTGFSPAQVPTGTGGTTTGGNQLPYNIVQPSGTNSPISGTRQGCVYKGTQHQQGDKWQDGCLYNCECVDASTGYYRCTDICPDLSNLPSQCVLIPDPNNKCCKTYTCNFQQTTTQAVPQPGQPGASGVPPAGSAYCQYNGRYYRQGETWNDGCSLKCRCEVAAQNLHQCTNRCPNYNNVPLGCGRIADPKDPQCCKIPDCNAVGVNNPGVTGGATPSGFSGTVTGYGKPPDPNSVSGYRSACLYKGVSYNQGDTWQDGCDYDCECTDASQGQYICTERCQRFASLPNGCSLVPDPNDRCCQKPACSPTAPTAGPGTGSGTATGNCRDKLQNCYLYGSSSCSGQYTDWARENCASFCGFCGTTPFDTANCKDLLPNCADYGSDSCSGSFLAWAQHNCQKTCGFCGATGGGATTSSPINVGGQTGPGTGGNSPVNCVDKLANCQQYDDTSCRAPYEGWALKNCPKRCNLCSQLTGGTGSGTIGGTGGNNPGVVTINPNLGVVTGSAGSGCYYNGKIYKQGDNWLDGCQYNCTCDNGVTGFYKCVERCPRYTNLPQGCSIQTKPGECCGTPVCVNPDGSTSTGLRTGCLYKNQVHKQGEQWDDGCDYKCTCVDGQTGQYRCTDKCVKWNLPSVCTLDPPAAGKCCSTPNCPSNVNIQYPAGYKPE